MVLELYVLTFLDITGCLVPVFVAAAGLRRARRSRGFNRWLYGYAVAVSALALGFLILTPQEPRLFRLAAQGGALLTLPFWIVVLEAARQTRSPRPAAPRRQDRPTGPAPAAPLSAR